MPRTKTSSLVIEASRVVSAILSTRATHRFEVAAASGRVVFGFAIRFDGRRRFLRRSRILDRLDVDRPPLLTDVHPRPPPLAITGPRPPRARRSRPGTRPRFPRGCTEEHESSSAGPGTVAWPYWRPMRTGGDVRGAGLALAGPSPGGRRPLRHAGRSPRRSA